ncbi:hypothetical protein BDV96DRAFT_615159 [Lophiotrema nucula]|uniref:FAD-binding PCMH-type domain-containing protein n=1 Tax=Lophiotrema nucula TaxID=690887 RepID=A0A6A5YTY7_9PLEO|nr:hypothetical protein BDV96DRAFT_615159 [Lophiotrema nucula]
MAHIALIHALPALVVRPSCAQDVSIIVREARLLDLKIAIKGGGHIPWAGAASIGAGGVLVDMRNVTGVNLGEDEETVSVGSGEKWESVIKILEGKGLATVGARVPRVGVTGFILGGGLSFFAGRYGFSCDAVMAFEVVLADGCIVKSSRTSHPDLFSALKGGSNNFGILTRIVLPAFAQGAMWGGMTIHPQSSMPELITALVDFAKQPNPDQNVNILVTYGFSSMFGNTLSASSLFDTAPDTSNNHSTSLEAFVAIEPKIQSTLRTDTLLSFAEEQGQGTSDNSRVLYFTVSVKADKQILLKIQALVDEAIESVKGTAGLLFSYILQPITTTFLVNSTRGGLNAMGLSPSDDAADDQLMRKVSSRCLEKVENLAKVEGKLVRWNFLNYADESQKVMQSYGAKSVAKLWERNVPGGFKLPKLE